MTKIVAVDNDALTVSIDMDVARNHIARTFSIETSRNWDKKGEHNVVYLRAQQAYANDRLFVSGYLFLNDVYEALGLSRTALGAILGWRKETMIYFGPIEADDLQPIRLEFNVDGPILDLI